MPQWYVGSSATTNWCSRSATFLSLVPLTYTELSRRTVGQVDVLLLRPRVSLEGEVEAAGGRDVVPDSQVGVPCETAEGGERANGPATKKLAQVFEGHRSPSPSPQGKHVMRIFPT